MAKRAFDLTVASILLIITLPLMLASALAVFICMGGPVCFFQRRTGLDGRPFTIYKLRTMRGEPLPGRTCHPSDAERITALGRVLRRWRLDELPQLVNVLRGEMSVVGPRPYPVDVCERLRLRYPDFDVRHRVRPGLVVPFPFFGRMRPNQEEVRRAEWRYVTERSLRVDLRHIAVALLTIPTRIASSGFDPQ